MRRNARIVFWISGIWSLTMAASAWLHSPTVKMVVMLPTIAFLGAAVTSIAWIFIYGSELGLRAAVPFFVCLGCGVLTAVMSPILLDAGFARVLPRYQRIIDQIEAGRIIVSAKPARIPLSEADSPLAYAVWGEKATDGVLTVTFLVGGTFRKHWGYRYCSAGNIVSRASSDLQWPSKRQLSDNWFYVSD